MKQYLNLIDYILNHGEIRNDRTGTGTISVFSPPPMRFDLRKGFPLVTTKFTSFWNIKVETLWLISGNTNVKWLQEHNCHIWDKWADETGNLGSVYGHQLRSWFNPNNYSSIDQLPILIDGIKNNPYSRRHLVSMWNVSDLENMALPPCHFSFQFYVGQKGLSCLVHLRGNDIFIGNPYNCGMYALLTHMIAQVTGLEANELIVEIGDAHIYLNHLEQVKTLLTREPLPLPTLWLSPEIKDIDGFTLKDIKILNYQSHPAIKGEVAV